MKSTVENYIKLEKKFGDDCSMEESNLLLAIYNGLSKRGRERLHAIFFERQEEYDREEEEHYRREMTAEAHFHAYPQ